jgi:hypothetical protein
MGILIFHETYQSCLFTESSFFLDIPEHYVCQTCPEGPCIVEKKVSRIDLTKKFKQSLIEPTDRVNGSSFIPDILLSGDSQEKLYIEIVYSHKSEPEKVFAGIPIVEIDITCEDDFALIESKEISFQDPRVHLYNFTLESYEVDASEKCVKFQENLQLNERHQRNKEIFKNNYITALENNRPVNMEIDHPCECRDCDGGPCFVGYQPQEHDLTKHFKRIVNEEPLPGDTVPRLAIMSDYGRKVYIEFSEAFRRNSGHKKCLDSGEQIIERGIESVTLAAYIQAIPFGNVSFKYHNINPVTITKSMIKNCTRMVHYFKILRNGKARIDSVPYQASKSQSSDPRVIYIKEVSAAVSDVFIDEVEAAFKEKIAVKNCFLCRYHTGANSGDQPIFCKYLKRTCGSNKAAECEFYRPDPKAFGSSRKGVKLF